MAAIKRPSVPGIFKGDLEFGKKEFAAETHMAVFRIAGRNPVRFPGKFDFPVNLFIGYDCFVNLFHYSPLLHIVDNRAVSQAVFGKLFISP